MSLIECCAGLSLGRLLTHRDQKLSEALKKQLSQKKNGSSREMSASGKPKDAYRQSKLKSPKRRKLKINDKLTSSASHHSVGDDESIQEQISELHDADSAVSVAASVPPEEEEEIPEVRESSSRIKTELSMLGHTHSSGHGPSHSKLHTEYSQDTFESLDNTLTSGTHPTTPPLGSSTPFKYPDRPPGGFPHGSAPEEDYSLSENRPESISGEL